MFSACLRGVALCAAILLCLPALTVAQEGEEAAPTSGEEVMQQIQALGRAMGRGPSAEQIDEFFGKSFTLAGNYIKSNPDAEDLDQIFTFAGARAQYGKNHEGFLIVCEAYLKRNPDTAKDSDWNKYYLAGSLSSDSRKRDAERKVKEIETQGRRDAASALLAYDIRLVDAAIRNDDKAKEGILKALRGNTLLTGSDEPAVYRKVMRIVFSNTSAEIKEGEAFPCWSEVMMARDLDGKQISMADYKGKVVLIDFWAVWCGPCIVEMPNVVKAYEQYKDKGFDVLGISLDRENGEDALRETIKGEGRVGARTGVMPWRQIYDGGFWNTGLSKRYGISSIPRTVLLDRDGKVVAMNLRGQALIDKVAELTGGDSEE
jgi:thiol-disulfide isomerase/thioredoxin